MLLFATSQKWWFFTANSEVHNLRYMVQKLYVQNRTLEPTLWTDNLGSGVPCDGPLGSSAHGHQVQNTESTLRIRITLGSGLITCFVFDLVTLYVVRIDTCRSLDRHDYTHSIELATLHIHLDGHCLFCLFYWRISTDISCVIMVFLSTPNSTV
jgi:hypothetical protein